MKDKDADHVVEEQLGGSSRRVRLTVIQSNQPAFVNARTGLPENREHCPDTSREFCPYVTCRSNLAFVEAATRPGRKGLGAVRRGKQGRTISDPGVHADDRQETLEPLWLNADGTLKDPPPPSCVLDVVRRAGRPMTNEEVGIALDRHRTLIAMAVRKAARRVAAAGYDLRDLIGEDEPHEPGPSRASPRSRRTPIGREP